MKQQAFRFPSPARPVLPLCTHHSPQPAAAAGQDAVQGAKRQRPLQEQRPELILARGHKSTPEGKEAERKGLCPRGQG